MPLTVRCPQCGKELVAPDELLGRVAACPGCQLQFPVTDPSRFSVASTATNVASPPVAKTVKPPASPPAGSAKQSTTAPVDATPPASRADGKPAARKSVSSGTFVAESPAAPAGTTAASAQRPVQAARFISASPNEQRIDLGADGRLPELVLREGGSAELATTPQRSDSTLLLVAVLAISFGLTALLLVWNPESSRSGSERQAAARHELELHYVRPHRRLEPYQDLLRRALQLHNQKKYAEERQCYRRVLDLLHEEHRETYKGLTGVRSSPSPPSDEHLESLLSLLLSNNR